MGSLPLMRHADRAASSGKGHAGVLFNIIHGREGDCKGEDIPSFFRRLPVGSFTLPPVLSRRLACKPFEYALEVAL